MVPIHHFILCYSCSIICFFAQYSLQFPPIHLLDSVYRVTPRGLVCVTEESYGKETKHKLCWIFILNFILYDLQAELVWPTLGDLIAFYAKMVNKIILNSHLSCSIWLGKYIRVDITTYFIPKLWQNIFCPFSRHSNRKYSILI